MILIEDERKRRNQNKKARKAQAACSGAYETDTKKSLSANRYFFFYRRKLAT